MKPPNEFLIFFFLILYLYEDTKLQKIEIETNKESTKKEIIRERKNTEYKKRKEK